MKHPASLNEREPRWLRRHEPVADSQFLAEPDAVWLLNQQRIGTRIDRITLDLLAEDHASGARTTFQQQKRYALPSQLVRGREASNATADNEHSHRNLVIGSIPNPITRLPDYSITRFRFVAGRGLRAFG